ncbi:MAG: glutamate racemase [Saprospiraceae bacterium]|nr:glutamate racemase [Saprospiraceae bacterium]
MSKEAIGIFDSGIGGLTIARGIAEALPNESIIYFGDTAHLPYGDKSATSIRNYSTAIVEFLIQKGCKLIVIACNSASAAASKLLAEQFSGIIPIINVIDPLVEKVEKEAYAKIGIIATRATVHSGVYVQRLLSAQPNLTVVSLATGLLAQMIEENYIQNTVRRALIHNYLSYPDFDDIEALLLACTHYPLIRSEIEEYWEGNIQVLDAIDVVAATVSTTLKQLGLEAPLGQVVEHQFYVSDYTPTFEQTAQLFYGTEIPLKVAPWQNGHILVPSIEDKLFIINK